MAEYELIDEMLLPKLFSYDYNSESIDTYSFVSFHKEMFKNILSNDGIYISSYNEQALVKAAKAAFLNVGYFLKDATYLGNGAYLTEKVIEYRTDVFEVMAIVLVNILRNMPIKTVVIGREYVASDQSKLALNNPNEHSVLSLYDELSRLYCIEYGIERNSGSYMDKLKRLIFERDKFIMTNDSFLLVKGMLRGDVF